MWGYDIDLDIALQKDVQVYVCRYSVTWYLQVSLAWARYTWGHQSWSGRCSHPMGRSCDRSDPCQRVVGKRVLIPSLRTDIAKVHDRMVCLHILRRLSWWHWFMFFFWNSTLSSIGIGMAWYGICFVFQGCFGKSICFLFQGCFGKSSSVLDGRFSQTCKLLEVRTRRWVERVPGTHRHLQGGIPLFGGMRFWVAWMEW